MPLAEGFDQLPLRGRSGLRQDISSLGALRPSLENGLMFTYMADTNGHAAMSPVTEDTWQYMRHPIPVVSPMSCCTAAVY
jgi:hypothetical protein